MYDSEELWLPPKAPSRLARVSAALLSVKQRSIDLPFQSGSRCPQAINLVWCPQARYLLSEEATVAQQVQTQGQAKEVKSPQAVGRVLHPFIAGL